MKVVNGFLDRYSQRLIDLKRDISKSTKYVVIFGNRWENFVWFIQNKIFTVLSLFTNLFRSGNAYYFNCIQYCEILEALVLKQLKLLISNT